MDIFAILLVLAGRGLADEDYATRETCQAFLVSSLPASLPHAASVMRQGDQEAVRRARQIVAIWQRNCLEAAEMELRRRLKEEADYDGWPWIDSHPEYADLGLHALLDAPVAGDDGNRSTPAGDYSRYRRATQLLVRAELTNGRTAAELWPLLLEMVAGDRRQCQANPSYHWRGSSPLVGRK